jgi:ATP-dependent 26S proteasome regulatory subunit
MDQKCCRADLANLVNEAALLAGRSSKEVVERIDFINAVERSIAVCATSLSKLVKNVYLPDVKSGQCHLIFRDATFFVL